MAKNSSDGLARLQNESRIPATTWRQWCNLLKMDPLEAIDVWEEICHPIMVANRKTPEIPYILQLRSGRLDLDIFEFKEEVAKVLHFMTFIYSLEDERLTKGKIKTALLKLYRTTGQRVASDRPRDYIERFIADACALVVVAKVLKGANITLTSVLKPVIDGAASLPQVVQLGMKSLGPGDLSDSIREFLEDPFLNPNAAARAKVDDDEDEDEQEEDDEEDDEYEEEVADTSEDEPDDDDDAEGNEDDDDDEADVDGDDDDYDDDDDDEANPIETVLLKFKTAIHALYEAEDFAGGSADEESDETSADSPLDKRLKVIAAFNPLRATIPSMEEAQKIAMRLERARNAGRNRPTLSARPAPPVSTGGGGGGGGGRGGGGTTVIKGGGGAAAGGGKKSGAASPADAAVAGPRPSPRSDGKGSDRVDMNKVEAVTVEPTDFVDAADVTFGEFSERVKQVCKGLATVESADQIVWSLFVDPAAAIGDVPALARALTRENTPTFKAYTNIRMAAQFMSLKNLLSTSDQALKKERNFTVELNQLLNYVGNSTRELQPDTRQLFPLGRVLDHAASALVRLEALRVNVSFAETHGDQYTREAVIVYYEEALRQITDETDRDVLNLARERADADSATMLASHEAQEFVATLMQTSRSFATELVTDGHAASEEQLLAALAANPLTFEGAEKTEAGDLPVGLLKPSDLGAIYDETAKHVCGQVWSVLSSVHQPEKVVPELLDMLREVMMASFRFKPEKRRHQDNARLALSVVSLDKVAGNSNLKDLYVRVTDDGQMYYVEDYEDGSFVDLFELREYKPARLASAAKKEADANDTEALQTGRKYLCTVGRTNRLIGEMPADVINGCVRDDAGATKVFPAF